MTPARPVAGPRRPLIPAFICPDMAAEERQFVDGTGRAPAPPIPAFICPDMAAEERRLGDGGPPGHSGVHLPGYSGQGTPV